MKQLFKNKSFRITLVLLIIINIVLIARYASEVWNAEEYCSTTEAIANNKNFDKGGKYWNEKISPAEYTEREKKWAAMGRDVTRSRREIIKCEDERWNQIKYLIFF
jgi:hypothetical protein